ncbi:uncharacterized protein BDZ99DRAFT_509386 [Mytilinidion resinicola]|uniref:GDP/GTP exchange factor Sec2 N-terminal domain-containing protein n=1 Tax=Mytilinidion resinicola TaxID=574789 RepID=A0A6A6YLW7_9PEZI|nr:uncharacterized protein BDZ99DRAFT_509386 [Mytilinidion resinicola]KAF2808974.1 hypothetical protein BDZ99DRAFT_509386 [Mytilinidion resinicola]
MSTAVLTPTPSDDPFLRVQAHTCPQCGAEYAHTLDEHHDADKRRIAELESQIRLLTEKATSAVDKLADYENELRRLKSPPQPPPEPPRSSTDTDPARPTTSSSNKTSRFSSLLGTRRASPTEPPPLPPVPSPDLRAALEREQTLRAAAEGQLHAMSGEIEDLSVQLFQQANEMVATERKARAKLEARVAVLEERDGEKRARLERLEGAMKRIERVRGLLVGG